MIIYCRVRLAAFLAVTAALPCAACLAQAQPGLPPNARASRDAAGNFTAQLDAISQVPLPGLPQPSPSSTAKPSELPKPFAAFSASASNLRDSLVALARAQIGRRYRLGG